MGAKHDTIGVRIGFVRGQMDHFSVASFAKAQVARQSCEFLLFLFVLRVRAGG